MKKFRFIFLFFLFLNGLFADVKLDLPSICIKDEPCIFNIEVEGENIKFPKLDEIAGFKTSIISNTSSTSIINSTISKKINRVYSIYPTKDFVFPSLNFIVDSKEFKTQEKQIKLSLPQKSKSNIFDFEISSSKKNLYVSESFELLLKFKYKTQTQILDLSFINPDFKNFWYKKLDYQNSYEENGFTITELKFLLFPQKAGELVIEPLRIDTQYVDNSSRSISFFSNSISKERIYSNALKFKVKELPKNINLIGNFEIKANVNKSQTKSLEAINYTIEIVGHGNFEDIKDFNLEIPGVNIYSNKPKIETKYIDNKNKGTYKKTYTIVSDKSYTIPSFSLSYFDKKTNKVFTKKTKEIYIDILDSKVNDSSLNKAVLEKLPKEVKEFKEKQIVKIIEESSLKDKLIYFSLGIISTLLTLGLYYYVINLRNSKKLNEMPLIKKVKLTKSSNELLKILSVYINKDPKLDELIYNLENTKDVDILKKDIIKLLRRLNLKG